MPDFHISMKTDSIPGDCRKATQHVLAEISDAVRRGAAEGPIWNEAGKEIGFWAFVYPADKTAAQ